MKYRRTYFLTCDDEIFKIDGFRNVKLTKICDILGGIG